MEFAQPPPGVMGTPTHLPPPNLSMPPPSSNNLIVPPQNQGYGPKFGGYANNRPPFRPFLNLQRSLPGPLGNMTLEDFDGKRLRKSVMRKTVDYNSSIIKALEVSKSGGLDVYDMLPPLVRFLFWSIWLRIYWRLLYTPCRDLRTLIVNEILEFFGLRIRGNGKTLRFSKKSSFVILYLELLLFQWEKLGARVAEEKFM